MRLIDADALIAKFDERADWGVCQIINKEPTVDALEQIRGGDHMKEWFLLVTGAIMIGGTLGFITGAFIKLWFM